MTQSITLCGKERGGGGVRPGCPRPTLELEGLSLSPLPLQSSAPPKVIKGVLANTSSLPWPCVITLGLQSVSDKHDSTVTSPGGDEGGFVSG